MHRGLRIVLANRNQVSVLLFHLDPARERRVQLALRSLHGDYIAFNLDRDSLGERYRLFSNSRHNQLLALGF